MDLRKSGSSAPGFSGQMHDDNAIINQIMLRFRPIAPKPAADGSVSDSMSASSSTNTAPLTKRNRPKRKYVRVNPKRNNNNNNNNNSTSGGGSHRRCKKGQEEEEQKRDLHSDGAVASSELTGPAISPDVGSAINMRFGLPITTNLGGKFGSNDNLGPGLEDGSDRAVESWVVANGVTTETLLDAGELGLTDGEKIRNLERDTCPGLISDGEYRVQWVNRAYRRMVEQGVGSGEAGVKVVAWLVLEEKTPVGWPVFACTVRVVYYTWRKEKHSKTMPCDVWKMDFGGFAWRLDAKAELCLGR